MLIVSSLSHSHFFHSQLVTDLNLSAVYFFRWILHNYSTPYALKLLRNLIPALKPGARILINDQVLPDMGTENPWDEGIMRGMDIVMLALLNAQERTAEEFKNLFELADPGFVFKVSYAPIFLVCACLVDDGNLLTLWVAVTGNYSATGFEDECYRGCLEA